VGLVVIVLGLWSFGIHGDFLWIDRVEILESGYRVTSKAEAVDVWTQSLDSYLERQHGDLSDSGGYLRPIYSYSISLDWLLWQDNPRLYKLVNVFWHLAVVLGLYVLGSQLLIGHRDGSFLSLGAAILFAVHPFGVHSVTWISGRKDTLCAALAISALILFGRLLKRRSNTYLKQGLFLFSIVVLLNLAMFSKELAIVTPLFATVWIWMRLGKINGGESDAGVPMKPVWGALILMWMSSLFCVVYRYFMIGGIGLNANRPSDSLLMNVATSCRLMTHYVGRVFVPLGPSIVDRWRVSDSIELVELGTIACVILVGIVLAYLLVKRIPEGLALAWFVVWLLPATGLVSLNHVYAERYLYPALWGLFLLLVMIALRLVNYFKSSSSRMTQKLFLGASVGLLAVFYTSITMDSFRHWKSESSLFGHAVNQNVNYVEGQSALALHCLDEKKFEESLMHSELAIESAKDKRFKSYMSPHIVFSNAGLAAINLGKTDRAIGYFEKAVIARPNHSLSYYHLAKGYAAKGQLDLAIENFKQSITIRPENHLARNDLGFVYLQTRQFQNCIEVLKPTVGSSGDGPLARSNLGSAHLMKKQFADAAIHFAWLSEFNDQDALNLAKLAWCKYEIGESEEAKTAWQRAFAISPDDPVVKFVQQTYVWPATK
jgi:tetratricopeptide (TPR) repeat protein